MHLQFHTADVFTDTRFGGNPLAMIRDASGLTGEQMQAIAAEFNLSETTFVLPPRDPANTAQVRIFTPRAELPFAGHPNVGTGYLLALNAERAGSPLERDWMVFEELAGHVRVELLREAGKVVGAKLRSPQLLTVGQSLDASHVAAACGVPADAISIANHPPLIAGSGNSLIFAEVVSLEALSAATPQPDVFAKHFPRDLAVGIHLYLPTPGGEADIRCRMFAPLHGIIEDPATGSANVALAGLLAHLRSEPDLNLALSIIQGVEMGRPSQLAASAEKIGGTVQATFIGGSCVSVTSGIFEL
jgi:trans-2,3-dihydro-3-hydroxyanthranilate isomerase